ncbi:MAG: YihY/virulence factor BrkB family protein [Actinobacteria bacterium]|nr:MAG: YihY/virulence factor BrkB family protein [Actinomycetota bacterium]TMM23031.1 MAG: YihY/virulence factor BrkB family protein [Actinomycetota bacterium]
MASRATVVNRTRGAAELLRERFARHELLTYASAIAFQVLKSLVPLTLLGLALLGAVGRRDVWTNHIAPALKSRLDPAVFHAIDHAVQKIFASSSVGLIILSSLLTVWFVSGGVRAVMGAINRIYEANDERPLWVRWPLSFGLAFCLVAGIVGAALLVEAVPKQSGALEILLFLVRWIGALAALVAVTGVLVRLAPARHRPKRWASAGAVLVIATWLVTSFAFRWYVSTFANFKTAVGQLTVFIVLMAYAYASSIVLLVGIEIDELLREDASSRERGILDVLFGLGR